MDVATIETYLTRYGWTFDRPAENVILTGFETDEMHFLLLIQFSAPWLRLSVPVYLPLLVDSLHPDLARVLFKLNAQSRLARFAIDENDQLIACVDVYTEPELTYEAFEIALDALTYLADTAYPYLAAALQPEIQEATNGES